MWVRQGPTLDWVRLLPNPQTLNWARKAFNGQPSNTLQKLVIYGHKKHKTLGLGACTIKYYYGFVMNGK